MKHTRIIPQLYLSAPASATTDLNKTTIDGVTMISDFNETLSQAVRHRMATKLLHVIARIPGILNNSVNSIAVNKALTGLVARNNGRYTHPKAVEYTNFLKSAVTVKDVWLYFAKENGLSETHCESIHGYDSDHFTQVLNQPLTNGAIFEIKPSCRSLIDNLTANILPPV